MSLVFRAKRDVEIASVLLPAGTVVTAWRSWVVNSTMIIRAPKSVHPDRLSIDADRFAASFEAIEGDPNCPNP